MPSEVSTVSGGPSVEELKRVFADIARAAARLCDYVAIYQVDGDVLRRVARQRPNGPVGRLTLPLTRGVAAGRAVLERRTVHVADMQTETEEVPKSNAFARQRAWLKVRPADAGSVAGGGMKR